eukprot:TRINITY_DN1666_c1_g1_i2.p1 TRINITY_DN1666_c1_g1~~TRINITY_DN1666_c1_g1_i2.p1  ORF type:complete len:143 (-),score=17.02 TRINITY_DN1666_c1_g1_i2:507-935(-)
MRKVYFVYLISCLFVLGRCEIFTWSISEGERSWEDRSNWNIDNTAATRSPCRNDTVMFPIHSNMSLITVSSNVEVLGINWQGRDITNISGLEEFFHLQNGGSVTIDPDCGGRLPCVCVTKNTARAVVILGVVILIFIFILTG